jgi:hypothetical protein
MPRRAKSIGSKVQAEPPPLDERLIERPDGFYWESKADGAAHGPFATRAEAEADMIAGGAAPADDVDDGESLHEAESELGINEWIDPDTGGPAEDNVPRIEDH